MRHARYVTNQKPDVPEGWEVSVIIGWFGQTSNPGDTDFVPAGRVQLPRMFSLGAHPPSGEWIVLYFAVLDNGEVVMPYVFSRRADVPRGLDLLREIRPLDWWRRHAITAMVSRGLLMDLAIEEINSTEHDREQLQQLYDDYNYDDNEEMPPPGRALPPTWKAMPDLWAKAVDGAKTVPTGGRPRNRITDAHLAEVVKVYQAADEGGRPPTRAVANAFNTSHSTAARWVGQARKKGMLPPAVRDDGKAGS